MLRTLILAASLAATCLALNCYKCSGTDGSHPCNATTELATDDCTDHGHGTCEIKIVNGAVHKMECGKKAYTHEHYSDYTAVSDNKKCKVTKEGKDKDCICNIDLCNRDANGNGAGSAGATGLLATALLALAMARI